jgi:hypothetical protein
MSKNPLRHVLDRFDKNPKEDSVVDKPKKPSRIRFRKPKVKE